MTWDNVYSWSQALAVLFAAAALISGFVVNKRQSDENKAQVARSLELKTDLSKALTKQAETEIALAELRKDHGPRVLIFGTDAEAFQNALKGKPTAKTEIWYAPDDTEAWSFAEHIFMALLQAGWKETSQPAPIPDIPVSSSHTNLPLLMRATGGMTGGLTITAKKLPECPIEERDKYPWWVLFDAFTAADKRPGGAQNEDLPEGTLRIIVGSKH